MRVSRARRLASFHHFLDSGPDNRYQFDSRASGLFGECQRKQLHTIMQKLESSMRIRMRNFLAAIALPALVASVLTGPFAGPAVSQNLFTPVVKVNDQAITRYELQQRARMLSLFRAPGDPRQLAREQLIEDRIKMEAAAGAGVSLPDEAIDGGMAEFAGRANMGAEEFVAQLEQAGVSEQTFRA